MKYFKPLFQVIFLALFSHSFSFSQNIYDTIRTVKMTALVDNQAKNLTIHWSDDPGPNTYKLFKKVPTDANWGNSIFSSGDVDVNYIDTNILEGNLYEYQVVKQTGDSLGYAYLFSGINYLPPQKKGDVLILIDSAAVDFVAENLAKYQEILISEGWIPWVEPVSKNAGVQDVKATILDYYEAVDSLTSVLLMGDIAVAHSGNIKPDGHADHKGAWPADLYYGDIDGVWTDETVDNALSAYPRIHNVPGDGNFDQDTIPSDIELAIGRMDFSELPIFPINEYQLLNNYLQKNLDFRTGKKEVKRRALIANLNPWREGLGQNGIRNFVPIVSNDSIAYGDLFDGFYNSFLWSYGASSGSMFASNGLGTITIYAENKFQAIFTAYFGSYYGDYDFENNILRTILASGQVLSTAWVGAPNWYFHPMGLGFDLGHCTRLTQNNKDRYYSGVFPKAITINLLGDPTLKAFIVQPPKELSADTNGNNVALQWIGSEDEIMGYQIYKKYAEKDYFEPINSSYIVETHFVDSCVGGDTEIQYLVKAVKQEITPSGTFINHSTGPIIKLQTAKNILPIADFNLTLEGGFLKAENLSSNATHYQWLLPNGESIFTNILEIPFTQIGEIKVSLIASNACFSDTLEKSIILTDIDDILLNEQIKIYPNPAHSFITLETSIFIDNLSIFDMLGSKVLSESKIPKGEKTIYLGKLINGSYLVKMHVGTEVLERMIILE